MTREEDNTRPYFKPEDRAELERHLAVVDAICDRLEVSE